MANRRLPSSKNHFNSRSALLCLALVSCLISINCASYHSSSQESSNDKITFGQRHDDDNQRDASAKDVYLLDSTSTSSRAADGKSGEQSDERANLTTLLEDEPTSNNDASKTTSTTTTVAPTPAQSLGEPGKTVSHWYTVSGNKSPLEGDKSQQQESVFSRLYGKLTSYLPFVENVFGKSSVKQASSERAFANNVITIRTHSKSDGDHDNEKAAQRADTKQSVSGPSETSLANNIEPSSSVVDSDTRASPEASMASSVGTFMDSDLDRTKIGVSISGSGTGGSKRDNTISVQAPEIDKVELTKHRLEGADANSPMKGEHKVSLVRQSSLVMPFKSNDELLIQSTSGAHPDSLLGKYIYAPEHHYHLTTSTGGKGEESEESSSYPQVSLRSTYSTSRLHPGDADLYGSYSGLRPVYASHMAGGPLNLVSDKTNDLYFLVMVAAFCAMAMAVVLAAGLFAYRVQQNRKSTSDSDYPTYGVVGPNNINAKCGAAFVGGGYSMGGSAGPGSSSSVNTCASGKQKQLGDTFTTSDSGIMTPSGKPGVGKRASSNNNELMANNNSGNNNGRSNYTANQNAARMYHYQHQKQQMIISDRASTGRHTSASDLDSEDENDDGSYTVYECPGLASAHEMEIKNPLFNDDRTP